MHFYWSLKSFPELKELEPSQRRVAWRACGWKAWGHWQTWAAFLGVVVLVLAAGFLGSVIDGQTYIWLGGIPTPKETMRAPVAAILLINIFGVAGFIAFIQVLCHMIRRHLKRYVESHHAA